MNPRKGVPHLDIPKTLPTQLESISFLKSFSYLCNRYPSWATPGNSTTLSLSLDHPSLCWFCWFLFIWLFYPWCVPSSSQLLSSVRGQILLMTCSDPASDLSAGHGLPASHFSRHSPELSVFLPSCFLLLLWCLSRSVPDIVYKPVVPVMWQVSRPCLSILCTPQSQIQHLPHNGFSVDAYGINEWTGIVQDSLLKGMF